MAVMTLKPKALEMIFCAISGFWEISRVAIVDSPRSAIKVKKPVKVMIVVSSPLPVAPRYFAKILMLIKEKTRKISRPMIWIRVLYVIFCAVFIG